MQHLFLRIASMLIFLALTGLWATSCEPDPNPVRSRQTLSVGKATFKVELAVAEAERSLGLMYRTSLAEDEGMLFVFEQDEHLSFWMKNTRIPLSIAYVSTKGEIKQILDMVPLSLAPVPSEYAVRYALEVNKGAFERAGVRVGDFLVLPQY